MRRPTSQSRSWEDDDRGTADAYDVVVIGAGIGGLTAGALLAHAGKRVLVVEAEAQPGGYARALCRGPYTFDRADHVIMGCAPEGPFGPGLVDSALRHLGVRDLCEFVRMDDPFYVGRFPGLTIEVPAGREAYVEAHARHFPGEARGIGGLAEISAEIMRQFRAFPVKPRPADLLLSPRRFPALFRYRNATISDVVDRELADPRLRAAYATLWPWLGPPPARASFLIWAAMLASYVDDGPYYCLGSFQRLADALGAALTGGGGQLLLGARVARIIMFGRRVGGVMLEDGRRIEVPAVISNVDPRQTFEIMLDPDAVPARYLRHLRRMEVSESLVALYVATDLDVRSLGARHDTTLYTGWDHESVPARALAGEVSWLSIVISTLKDPTLAPPGEHLLILKTSVPADGSEAPHGDRPLADRMLEVAEDALPGLRRHLTFVDETGSEADPRLHRLGPYSGWTMTPSQSGIRRLPQETPVHGLVLVGQWTRPGLGVSTVVQSGLAAARLVLGAPTSTPALPLRV